MRIMIIVCFIAILVALASALFELLRPATQARRTVKALTYRIGLSIALFVFLMVGFATGILRPHGL